jgi:diketogulonate reductase-like aldo/keto reductase
LELVSQNHILVHHFTISADIIGTAHYGKECTEHVLSALNVGYRYLDGAEQYRNGASVREGFQQWGGKRDEVYILTKCESPRIRSGES